MNEAMVSDANANSSWAKLKWVLGWPRSNEDRSCLSQTDRWFRDGLFKLFGWAAASFLLLSGWLFSGEEVVRWGGLDCESKACDRALGVLVAVPLGYAAWLLAVCRFYSRCKRNHATTPGGRRVAAYAALFAVGLFLVLGLALRSDSPDAGAMRLVPVECELRVQEPKETEKP